MRDLRILPKYRDGLSYLYVEKCRVDQDQKAVVLHDEDGKTPVPCAALSLLMMGPGTTITHAAIKTLAQCGCIVIWCGEESVRYYAQGLGETRKADHLIKQAKLISDPVLRLQVVRRLYQLRFREKLDKDLPLNTIRGKEGIRVRETYRDASKTFGVEWKGRNYNRDTWGSTDPINRALSAANSCLYGICHSAIVSVGYSPSLGFIHTGKMLSFVYDIADLYKTEISIPVAFQTTAEGTVNLESRVRKNCRDIFYHKRLMSRIIPDIDTALSLEKEIDFSDKDEYDYDPSKPGGLWDPDIGEIKGGIAYDNLEP